MKESIHLQLTIYQQFCSIRCSISLSTHMAKLLLDCLGIHVHSDVLIKRISSRLSEGLYSKEIQNNATYKNLAGHLFLGVWLSIFGLLALPSTAAWADNPTAEPSRTIRVGAYENKPMTYTDESGKMVGLFPDVLNSIAQKEDWRLGYVHGTWSECLDRLEKNEIDIMVDVADSETGGQKFLFNKETVFVNWAGVYTAGNANIDSLAHLKGKKIAVMKGSIHTVGDGGIINLMAGLDIPCTFVEVESYDDVLQLLSRNEVSAGVVSRIYGYMFAERYDVNRTSIIFNQSHLKFAFNRKSPLSSILIAEIDRNLSLQKEDPDSIYSKALFVYLSGLPREMMFSDPR